MNARRSRRAARALPLTSAFASVLAVLAVLADAGADLSARVTYAAIAAAVVYAAGQLAGGAPAAQTINTLGWVALTLAVARLAFTLARTLLADGGDQAEAVTT